MAKKLIDSKIIDVLGGPKVVCNYFGWKQRGGWERVNNWRTRGIPARIELNNLSYFRKARKVLLDAR